MQTVADRIFYIIEKDENLNETQFSKKIGVSQSTIYSLRRSKDGYVKSNIIAGIRKVYPRLNLDWLLFGEGEMFVDSKKIIQGDGNNVNIQTDNRESTVINGESNSTSGQDCTSLLEKKDIEIAALQKQMELLQGQIDLLHNQIKDKDNIIRLLQM